jgi:hypothetical protein
MSVGVYKQLSTDSQWVVRWPMAFVELTRILPENKKVKWSVNQNNIVYFQESISTEANAGCSLIDVAGTEIDVVESYQEVKAKLKDS